MDWKKLSENSILVCYVCVVTLNDYTTDTNDNMTTKTDFHTEHINTNTWVHSLLSVRTYRHIAHCTATAQVMSCVHSLFHPHALMMCAVLPRHWSLHSLHPLLHAPPVRTPSTSSLWSSYRTCTLRLKRVWPLIDETLLPHRLWAQRLRLQGDLRRVLHRASKGSPTTPRTMTPRSRICCVKLTEYMSITLNEKTCLSVCWRESGATCWAK